MLTLTFRRELQDILEIAGDHFRNTLAKPLYREMLRSGYNLLIKDIMEVPYEEINEMMDMQDLHISRQADTGPEGDPVPVGRRGAANDAQSEGGFEEESLALLDLDEDSIANELELDKENVQRLIRLIIARLNQEYFDTLLNPNANVLRAWESSRLPEHNTTTGASVELTESSQASFGIVRPDTMPAVGQGTNTGTGLDEVGVNGTDARQPKQPMVVTFDDFMKHDTSQHSVALASASRNRRKPVMSVHWSNPYTDLIEEIFQQWL